MEELNESEDVAYSGSDAQDGSKRYYRSLELQEQQFLNFLAGGKSFIAIPIFLRDGNVSHFYFDSNIYPDKRYAKMVELVDNPIKVGNPPPKVARVFVALSKRKANTKVI